jgi:hypothetical protein
MAIHLRRPLCVDGDPHVLARETVVCDDDEVALDAVSEQRHIDRAFEPRREVDVVPLVHLSSFPDQIVG